jgi:GNAT superfamily N-acetyltransferase
MSGAFIAIQITRAVPADAPECVRMRGMTRENAIPEEWLRAHGITAESWAEGIGTGRLPGWVARRGGHLSGYCFGASETGEVVVLALLPQEEGKGIGKRLLEFVINDLRSHGHTRLFLGCSSDPGVRSYGFYRHLRWESTGTTDQHGDEVLELRTQNAGASEGDAFSRHKNPPAPRSHDLLHPRLP